MKKNVSILGSTGSIGLNALKIFQKNKNLFKINILIANKNFPLISKQIKELKPNIFVINDLKVFNKVKKKFRKSKTNILNKLYTKNNSLKKSDITVAAIPGIAGLDPTITMVKISKKILIANKESIICGWNLIKKTATNNNTKIIPVDSEHFSIMKLLENHNIKEIKKIYLTASGGPFLKYKLHKLKSALPQEAIKHPKWKMGKKISVDSASLMNKMFEIVEAQKLFMFDIDKIEIVIHPESLVHAIIELKNGLFKFIYHETTMLIPLANAIFEKEFKISDLLIPKFKKKKKIFFKNLNFINVDKKRFPIIKLKSKINEYYSTPIIINATNEILVDEYLKKKIGFTSFYGYILKVLNDRNYKKYAVKVPKNINQIHLIDQWARKVASEKIDIFK